MSHVFGDFCAALVCFPMRAVLFSLKVYAGMLHPVLCNQECVCDNASVTNADVSICQHLDSMEREREREKSLATNVT